MSKAKRIKQEIDVEELKKEAITQGDEGPKLSDEFVQQFMPMVEAISANIIGGGKVPPGTEFNDLVSWGIEGLIKAFNNFKANKGSQFKTYAYYRVRGEIFDKIRSEWRYRNPTEHKEIRKRAQEKIAAFAKDALDNIEQSNGSPEVKQRAVESMVENTGVLGLMSLENVDIVSDKEGTKNPEQEFIDESESVLWDEIHHLDDDERMIIELFYVRGLKQKEIAEKMNISRSTICRMHMKILDKLRHRLKGKI